MGVFQKCGLMLLMTILGWGGIMSSSCADVAPYDRDLIMRKASTVSEIGVAFLKTANLYPDFNTIVENMPEYKKQDPLAQKDFKAKEVGKLQSIFLGFEPKKSDLIVRLGINVVFNKKKDGTASLDLKFPQDGPIYVPFYFGNYPIALIIDEIDAFKHIELTAEEAQIVYSRLGLDGAATLLLQIYPMAADDKTHVMLDDIPQYPLLSEIGYIGLINTRMEQIWAWKSPKYGKKTNPLADLMVPPQEKPEK